MTRPSFKIQILQILLEERRPKAQRMEDRDGKNWRAWGGAWSEARPEARWSGAGSGAWPEVRWSGAGRPARPRFRLRPRRAGSRGGLSAVVAGFFLATAGLWTPAFAHHDQALSRVQNNSANRFRFGSGPSAGLLGRAGLSFNFAHFGQTLRGSKSAQKLQVGTVSLHTLDLEVGVTKNNLWSLQLGLPMGMVVQRPSMGPKRSDWGFGDLRLVAQLQLLALFAPKNTRNVLWLSGGIEAPTGRYRKGAALTATEVKGLHDGTINVQTYNVQTSLGAGLWTPMASLRYERRLGERFLGAAQGNLRWPVGQSADRHRWGLDLGAQGQLGAQFFKKSTIATLSAEYLNHRPDRIWLLDEVTAEGKHHRLGGRQSLIGALGLEFRWASRWSCHVDARVPLWQQVKGVSLVQSIAVSTGCAAQIGLAKNQSRPAKAQPESRSGLAKKQPRWDRR